MKIKAVLLVVAMTGAVGAAQAESHYWTELKLTGLEFDQSTDLSGGTGWTGAADTTSYVRARDLLGTPTAAPMALRLASAKQEPTWSDWIESSQLASPSSAAATWTDAQNGGIAVAAGNAQSLEYLHVKGDLSDVGGDAYAGATWERGFVLGKGQSVTFTSKVSFGATMMPLGSLVASNTFTPDSPLTAFNALGISDSGGRGFSSIGTWLQGGAGDIPGNAVSYSTDLAAQTLSLTVTNRALDSMAGTLYAGSFVNLTSAVPEPEAYASLLLGLGVLGAMARRQKKASPDTARA